VVAVAAAGPPPAAAATVATVEVTEAAARGYRVAFGSTAAVLAISTFAANVLSHRFLLIFIVCLALSSLSRSPVINPPPFFLNIFFCNYVTSL
jgi:hypothetical protein